MAIPRTLKWATIGIIGPVLALLAAGVAYEQVARWRSPRVHPPPGTLLDVGGTRLHLNCVGDGAPVVILEGGLGSPSLVWVSVQPSIAEVTRICSYDRAGLGWSDRSERPRHAEPMAEELHALLRAGSVPPPYVLVGHSLGGPLAMVYADMFPDDVAGFVFVDVTDPDYMVRMPSELEPTEEQLKARRNWQRAASFLAATGVMRISARSESTIWPPEMIDKANAFAPQSLTTVLREAAALEQILARARAAMDSFGDRPTLVLTAGRSQDLPDLTREQNDQLRALRVELQAELAERSTNSDQRAVYGSGHFIQIEDPDAVIGAVGEVVDAVRTGGSVRGGGS